ncbi:MAG: molybdopterin-dependent oxidoreductase [Polaromonas sp.]
MPLLPRRQICLSVLLAFVLAAPALALEAAQGKVVLSISGQITQKNVADRADFDMAMLAALPQHTFTTGTPWFVGPKKFTGPLLRDVLAAVGAQGTNLRAVALNNFKIDIPADDAVQFPVIVARLMQGQPMPIREKGPLFIVYPYDTDIALRSTRYYNRSAWQLRAIEVK